MVKIIMIMNRKSNKKVNLNTNNNIKNNQIEKYITKRKK